MATACGSDGVTLTVRFIRSFEYRNFKAVVFHKVNLNQTTEEFITLALQEIKAKPGIAPPFRIFLYDTLKIQHKAYGAKTNDPIIRTDKDDILILKSGLTLNESGVENETELSFFKRDDYLEYKKNPVLKW